MLARVLQAVAFINNMAMLLSFRFKSSHTALHPTLRPLNLTMIYSTTYGSTLPSLVLQQSLELCDSSGHISLLSKQAERSLKRCYSLFYILP